MEHPTPIMPGAALVQLSGPTDTLLDLVETLDALLDWEIASSISREELALYDKAALILTHTPETVGTE